MTLVLLALCALLLAACANAPHAVPVAESRPLVSFVLDDGNDTDFLLGREIFAAQGAVACSAVTTDLIGTPYHLTPEQIRGLEAAGWEIMSHSVSHPRLPFLSPDELELELSRSKAVLEGLGVRISNLVYPYNSNSARVRVAAARFYRSARGGGSAFNDGRPDPFLLRSFSIRHDLAGMKRLIDRAHAERSWLIFYHHEIDTKLKISEKRGSFQQGETVRLSPSGAVARYTTTHWFPLYGYHLYLVPLSGTPRAGDLITGVTSGATARIDYTIYDEIAQLGDMLRYIRATYPDMEIVTIDQGLDLLGVPRLCPERRPEPTGNTSCTEQTCS